MPTFPNECIDLTVTSPPYDNLRTYKGFVFDFETIAKELYRVTKQGGVVVWVVNDATINGSETLTSFKQAIFFKEQCGFNLHDTMIYQKDNPIYSENSRYIQSFEYTFILSKGKPKTFNPLKERTITNGRIYSSNFSKTNRKENGATSKCDNSKKKITNEFKIKKNIFSYSIGMGNTTKDNVFQHSAVFPEKLAKDHIYSWSNEGDTVLDPMCGSGTTPKMAVLMNRNYLAIESAKEYYDLSVKRVGAYEQQINAEFQKAI